MAKQRLQTSGIVEVEAKFRLDPDEAARIRQRLEALQIGWDEPVEQRDLYLAHPARDFGVTDEALRIRQVGNRAFLTYKGPKLSTESKTRRELELPLAPETADPLAELFGCLGFRRVAEVRKRRHAGRIDEAGREWTVSFDEVEGVGCFLEIETSADGADWQSAQEALRRFAESLELGQGIRESYLELLLERGGAG